MPRRQVRQALEGLRRRADQAERRAEPLGVAVRDETAVDGEPRVAGVLEREAMRAGGGGRQRPGEARGVRPRGVSVVPKSIVGLTKAPSGEPLSSIEA